MQQTNLKLKVFIFYMTTLCMFNKKKRPSLAI